jgi:hypothetical protein
MSSDPNIVKDHSPNGQPVSPPASDNRLPPDSDPPSNPFDPESLRLSGTEVATLGVKKALITVPIRKPSKDAFVRTHPSPDYRLLTATIELKDEREIYVVAPHLRAELAAEATFSPRALYTAITKQGVLFLWPIRMPGPDGKIDDWNRSAMRAADMAVDNWVRVTANMSLGAYEVFEATGDLGDPEFPDLPFADLLKIALRDRFIDTRDHPVLRRLRGEV